jgi:hypothetical protein
MNYTTPLGDIEQGLVDWTDERTFVILKESDWKRVSELLTDEQTALLDFSVMPLELVEPDDYEDDSDVHDSEIEAHGFYWIHYGYETGHVPPEGPYATIRELCQVNELTEYPEGYIMEVDATGPTVINSFNPDDLFVPEQDEDHV